MIDEERHTPGPWFDWERGEWLQEPQKLLARLPDARLMAAASDMLAALRLVDAFAKEDQANGDDNLWTDHFREMFEVVRAAIAKATGAAS